MSSDAHRLVLVDPAAPAQCEAVLVKILEPVEVQVVGTDTTKKLGADTILVADAKLFEPEG
jgi:hypothetical protein